MLSAEPLVPANRLAWAPLPATAGGLEIIGGQAYGAENYKLLGLVLQQALILTTIVCGLVGVLWSQVRRREEGTGGRMEQPATATP